MNCIQNMQLYVRIGSEYKNDCLFVWTVKLYRIKLILPIQLPSNWSALKHCIEVKIKKFSHNNNTFFFSFSLENNQRFSFVF